MNILTSKIITWSLIFFILGVGVSSFLSLPFFVYIPLFLLFLIVWLVILPTKRISPAIFLILFFIFGVFRYQISFPKIDQSHISYYNGSRVVFRGKVIKEPDQRVDEIKITIGDIILGNLPLQGRVLVDIPLYSDYQYGDLVEINCQLNEPGVFANFNYYEYLARYDVYSTCYWPEIKILKKSEVSDVYSKILVVKNKFERLIDLNFSEPQGSILSALLLGRQREIPQDLRAEFSRAGVSHILAVSGLHISVLCALLSYFFVTTLHLRRSKAFYLIFAIIFVFVVLVGAPPSAIRAVIMGLATAYAMKIGRPKDFFRILVFSGFLMLLFNPKLLKSDVGFQLSFMSVLGMSLMGSYFNSLFQKIPNFHYFPLRHYLSASLSAQLFVFPLILYYFGNLSLIAVLANILILPVLPIGMAFGFIFFLGGVVGLAKILIWPSWLILTYTILLVKFLSAIPGLSFTFGKVHFIIAIILYVLIAFFVVQILQRQKRVEQTDKK